MGISAIARRWNRAAVVLLCAGGIALSAFLSFSWWLASSPSHLDTAIALQPWNPSFLFRRSHPADLAAAVTLAPHRSQYRIALALHHELQGRPDEAERCLLEAARADATYAPRWALANFYARAHRPDSFWRWAIGAVALYEGDLTALYLLALTVEPYPAVIWQRLAPRRADAQRQFLDLFLTRGDPDSAALAGAALAAHARPRDRAQLLSLCDRAIEARAPASGLPVWNAMAASRLIPYNPLDPARGEVLTNGGLHHPPCGCGFDWRLYSGDGITIAWRPPSGLRITLSGSQPDRAPLLRQLLPVAPGARYRLASESEGDVAPQSLEWSVNGLAVGANQLFTTPDAMAELELAAVRREGFPRPRGSFRLIRVAVAPETQPGP